MVLFLVLGAVLFVVGANSWAKMLNKAADGLNALNKRIKR